MRYFPMVMSGVLVLVGIFFFTYGLRGISGAETDSERVFALYQIGVGLGGLASSAVLATLGAILGLLEDRWGKAED